MSNLYKELARENSMIQDNHAEFRDLHKEIWKFDLEDLVKKIDITKEEVIEKRPVDSERITRQIDYADSLIEQYDEFQNQDPPIEMPTSTKKIQKMADEVVNYREKLERLIKENYNAFCKYSKKERKTRKIPRENQQMNILKTRFAKEFKNYFESGQKYSIHVLWHENSKIKEINEYLGELEAKKATQEIKTKKPSPREKLQYDLANKKAEIVKKETESAKLRYQLKKEETRIKRFEKLQETNPDKAERYKLYVQAVDQDIIDKGSVDSTPNYSLDVNLSLLGDNQNYSDLFNTLKDVDTGVHTIKSLGEKIDNRISFEKFAEDKNDLDYIKAFYTCVKEPLRRGVLLGLRTRDNEEAIERMLDNFENYIEKSENNLKASQQYSTKG